MRIKVDEVRSGEGSRGEGMKVKMEVRVTYMKGNEREVI